MIYLVFDNHAVWGFCKNKNEAIKRAAQWLCDENGEQGVSVDKFKEMLITEDELKNGYEGFAVVSYDAKMPKNADFMTSYEWITHYYKHRS